MTQPASDVAIGPAGARLENGNPSGAGRDGAVEGQQGQKQARLNSRDRSSGQSSGTTRADRQREKAKNNLAENEFDTDFGCVSVQYVCLEGHSLRSLAQSTDPIH